MDKRLSNKNQKMLLNALERAKEMGRQMEQKQEDKRWASLEVPLNLEDSLAKLTKSDLSEIRLHWGVQGASALKKQDLIAALRQQMPTVLPAVLNELDDTRYKILRELADRGGHGFVPLESHQVDYFRSRGLIFSGTYKGKRTLAMPQEVLECFQHNDSTAYRETIRRNTEWIKLTNGLLFYYGTLDINELEQLLTTYTGQKLRMGEFYYVLQESVPFYRAIKHTSSGGLSNNRVWDDKRVKKEQAMRSQLPFYPFSKAQLLLAGEPDFVDRNPSYRAFFDFIVRNYALTRDEVDSLVEECVYAIHIGEQPADVLKFLQMRLEMEDLETVDSFMGHIAALHNNTRQWFIKGYTPNELSAARNKAPAAQPPAKAEVIDFATRKTVGRNDPCPCGSGKKFKKCCG